MWSNLMACDGGDMACNSPTQRWLRLFSLDDLEAVIVKEKTLIHGNSKYINFWKACHSYIDSRFKYNQGANECKA